MITENRIEAAAQFNKVFKPANEWRGRYRILKGSAGSGKSVNIAQDYIIKLSDPYFRGANLLVVRRVEATNRDSTFAELQSAIFRIFGSNADRAWRIRANPLSMECRITGSEILFRGMNDARQREKVKSVTVKHGKLTWIWCEEATEFMAEDVDILDDRLRGELAGINPNLYYQLTMTFNPVSATHWIKGRYFDRKSPEVLAHHSTYKDNRFIDDAYYRRMERRRVEDPEGYRIYGEGEWGEIGGLILTRIAIEDFDTRKENFDAFYYGQDFGYNHANAILGVGSKDGDLFVCSEIYCFEKDSEEIIQIARERKLDTRVEMFCDSASPDQIKTWRKAGFRAIPVNKGGSAGSVKAQIDWLKARTVHIHPSCVHTISEVQQWRWKKDTMTGSYLDEPVEFMDDAMAALRYSIERLRRGASIEVLR